MYFFQFADTCCLFSDSLGLWKSTMFFHVLTVPYSYQPIWFPWKKHLKGVVLVARCGRKHWTFQGRNLTERFHGVPSANSAGRLDWCWLG